MAKGLAPLWTTTRRRWPAPTPRRPTKTQRLSSTCLPTTPTPVANNDAATIDEDTSATVSVLANDSDVDGDSLTVTSVTQGAHGSVVANADGTVSYTPAANFNGTDQFTYTISDGQGGTASATV